MRKVSDLTSADIESDDYTQHLRGILNNGFKHYEGSQFYVWWMDMQHEQLRVNGHKFNGDTLLSWKFIRDSSVDHNSLAQTVINWVSSDFVNDKAHIVLLSEGRVPKVHSQTYPPAPSQKPPSFPVSENQNSSGSG